MQSDDEQVFLTPDEAIALLPENEQIHTVRSVLNVLIGAHWPRKKIIGLLYTLKPELSGENATKSGHGLCVFDEYGPLFIETKSKLVIGEKPPG